MLRLFRMQQRTEVGAGYLPDAGGVLDQAIIMLESFDAIAACEAHETDTTKVPEDADGNPDGNRVAKSFKEAFGFI